jgi:TRAP transporter TAXI family solute receptor
MRRRSALAALLAVPAGVATAGCDDDDPPPVRRLVIAGGPPGTAYSRFGGVLADTARKRWKIPAELLPTDGSVDNVRSLMDGPADLAFTTVDVAAAAQQGDKPFSVARPIAALASLYDDYLHIVVRADDDINDLADLAGKKVSTGPANSAVSILADRLLNPNVLGTAVPPDTTDHHHEASVAADLLEKRSIDAFFTIGALPDDLVAKLSARLPIRLLPAESEARALGEKAGEYFVTRSVPANTYGPGPEVVTLGVRTILVVRRTVADEVAYGFVRLLFEAREALQGVHPEAKRLDERSSLATYPIDLHPGVAQYYREAKLLA